MSCTLAKQFFPLGNVELKRTAVLAVARNDIVVPKATILLTCGRDRELWPEPIF